MIYDVSQEKLVLAVAQELKGMIEMPEWANFVKTGAHRETMPKNTDWWYIRAASILRFAYKSGPIGVNKLRTRYGGRKNRGYKPDAFALCSGKVLRVILQQLESVELVKQDTIGNRKGRVFTPKGASLLVNSAKKLLGDVPAPAKKAPVKKAAAKKAPAKKAEAKSEE